MQTNDTSNERLNFDNDKSETESTANPTAKKSKAKKTTKKKDNKAALGEVNPATGRVRDLLWDKLVELTQMDKQALQLYGNSRFGIEVKRYRSAGITPEDLDIWKQWYPQCHYLGRKNVTPTIYIISQSWTQFKQYLKDNQDHTSIAVRQPQSTTSRFSNLNGINGVISAIDSNDTKMLDMLKRLSES